MGETVTRARVTPISTIRFNKLSSVFIEYLNTPLVTLFNYTLVVVYSAHLFSVSQSVAVVTTFTQIHSYIYARAIYV